LVGSTERVAALGDRAWRDLVEPHHAVVRGLLARYRGREVDTAGDGFFATFDGPACAVRRSDHRRRAASWPRRPGRSAHP
jgi:class 3 adenylate cyclase